MASLFKTISRSFLNTLLYLWSLLKAVFTFRALPKYPAASRSSFLATRQNDLEWGETWGLQDTGWKVERLTSQVMTEARLQHLRSKAVNAVMTQDAHQIGLMRQSPAFIQQAGPDRRSHKRVFYDISLGETSSPVKSFLSRSISDPFSMSIYSGDAHYDSPRPAHPAAASTPAPTRKNGRSHKRSAMDTIGSMREVLGSRPVEDIPPLPIPPAAFSKLMKPYPPSPATFIQFLPAAHIPDHDRPNNTFNLPTNPASEDQGHDTRRSSPSLRRVRAYNDLQTQRRRSDASVEQEASISSVYNNTSTSPLRIIKRKPLPDSDRTPNQTQASSTFLQKPTVEPVMEPTEMLGKVRAVFDGLRAHNEGLDTREAMSRESYWTNATHGTSACGHDSSLDESVSSSSDSSNPSFPGSSVDGESGEEEPESDEEEEYGNEIQPREETPPMPYPSLSLSPPDVDISVREDELKKLRLDSPLSALTFSFGQNHSDDIGGAVQSPASSLEPSFPLTPSLTPLPSTDIAYLQKDAAMSRHDSTNSNIQDILTSFEDLVSSMGPRYQGLLGTASGDELKLSPMERSSLVYGYHAYAGVSEDCVAEWYDVLHLDSYT